MSLLPPLGRNARKGREHQVTTEKRWKFDVTELSGPKPLPTVIDEASCRRFFQYLYDPLGLIWHPDEEFKEYVELESGVRIFSPGACELLDAAMARCFELLGERVYDVALDEDEQWSAIEHSEERVRELLSRAGVAYKPCGLNADWAVSAYHLSPGEPNKNSGDHYLLDDEETDDSGRPLFSVVRRVYLPEDQEGNDDVLPVVEQGLLQSVISAWVARKEGY